MQQTANLSMAFLRDGYRSGRLTPRGVCEDLLRQADGTDPGHVWITRLTVDQVMHYIDALDPAAFERLPLYGIPFAIKDNIDLQGVYTTAACPRFAFRPTQSATVVAKLIGAGAIPVGKTNLDQFATGLVGTRSPYGECHNSFDADYISGGSSSGSAVAVASGLVSFALGTDTAGSGRVPAAFNNIVGLKPSNGRLSTAGVVPACRSLDCVSIFALTTEDAARVLDSAAGIDARDPYSRTCGDVLLAGLRVGVPRPDQLEFFGDAHYRRLFAEAVERLARLGGRLQTIDFEPFLATARLLYEGPWIAERYAAVGEFIETLPDAVHPITRQIIAAGKGPTAVAAFQGEYARKSLEQRSLRAWADVDLILTPTAGTLYRREQLAADPLRLNANLGYYTNFMNLLDLCGVAVPAGFRPDGLPFGVTLIGPRGTERALLELAGRFQRDSVATLGALRLPVPAAAPVPAPAPVPVPAAAPIPSPDPAATASPDATVRSTNNLSMVTAATADARQEPQLTLAVCGAHMDGLPLNHQLRDRGAYRLRATCTTARYRLFALAGGPPQRPGLIRVADAGARIELELWSLPLRELGGFLTGIPAPLGLGKIELESGEWVTGFICEGYGATGAVDITQYGGWRAYLDQNP